MLRRIEIDGYLCNISDRLHEDSALGEAAVDPESAEWVPEVDGHSIDDLCNLSGDSLKGRADDMTTLGG